MRGPDYRWSPLMSWWEWPLYHLVIVKVLTRFPLTIPQWGGEGFPHYCQVGGEVLNPYVVCTDIMGVGGSGFKPGGKENPDFYLSFSDTTLVGMLRSLVIASWGWNLGSLLRL